MPLHALMRMHVPVVPTLTIHRIRTKHLQLASLDLRAQRSDHSAVFILVEPPLRGWKHQQRHSPVSEDQHFHLSVQFGAMSFVIFPVHCSLAAVSYQRAHVVFGFGSAHVARAPPPAAVALFLLLLLILLLILNLALTLGLTQLIFELALAFGWRSALALRSDFEFGRALAPRT